MCHALGMLSCTEHEQLAYQHPYPQRKVTLSVCSLQLPIASPLQCGLESPLQSTLEFWLAWFFARLVQATTAALSWCVQQLCNFQKLVFHNFPTHPLAITFFLTSRFSMVPEPWMDGNRWRWPIYSWILIFTYSQYSDHLGVSVLTTLPIAKRSFSN